MAHTKIKKRFNQLRDWPEYSGKTDDEVMIIAQRSLDGDLATPLDKLKSMDVSSRFIDVNERKVAEDLTSRYLQDYTIESISDRNTLQELIYFEVLQRRLQNQLNEMNEGDIKAQPFDLMEQIRDNSDMIIKLKGQLGLNKGKDKTAGYDVIVHLQKRFDKWLENNQVSRTIKCPHCMQFIWLKLRAEMWESLGHPYFQDNMICNKHLFANRNKTVKVDDKFIADVLGVSTDYISSWVIPKLKQ